MAATDLVPCFYTGQNYRTEKPAEVRVRSEVRELKKRKLGKFVANGTLFLFSRAIVKKMVAPYDGPLGVGNVVPFARLHNYGDRLHYEIPMAGDIGLRRHNLFRRTNEHGVSELRTRIIRVSARSRSYPAAAVLPTHNFASTLLAG
ncbi:MAG TPA: hypothetical protein VFO27_11435 [Bryobacteraceae bacterium]|nr:hypothetical protein [Bryobacteraceae bacterium]